MSKEPTAGGTQALTRALGLLSCFTEEARELRITELCARTGLNQSTVSRMMAALDRAGFVQQDVRTGLYRLGIAAVSLGTIALNSNGVYAAARQIAQQLALRSDLGANVAELVGDRLRYLCNFEGSRAPKSFSMAGRSAPLHATAMGKALLSTMPPDAVSELLDEQVPRFTPHTIVSPIAMHEACEEIRQRGYAVELEELAFGRACVAAPIRDHTRAGVAAISVSGPLSAFGQPTPDFTDLARQVVEAADEISIALGYSALRNSGHH